MLQPSHLPMYHLHVLVLGEFQVRPKPLDRSLRTTPEPSDRTIEVTRAVASPRPPSFPLKSYVHLLKHKYLLKYISMYMEVLTASVNQLETIDVSPGFPSRFLIQRSTFNLHVDIVKCVKLPSFSMRSKAEDSAVSESFHL